ncbi:MAG: hypothetical protein ACK5LN_12845 [Propioniciclava sp.]
MFNTIASSIGAIETTRARKASAGEPAGAAAESRSRVAVLAERGLTTVEYAIGIVLVLSIVGLLIKASAEGWFMSLVKGLIESIFKAIASGIAG